MAYPLKEEDMRDEYNIAELNPRKNPYVEAPFTATTQENVYSVPEAQMPADTDQLLLDFAEDYKKITE